MAEQPIPGALQARKTTPRLHPMVNHSVAALFPPYDRGAGVHRAFLASWSPGPRVSGEAHCHGW